jgi:predicted AAA+ superfamily ATPase
MYTLEDDLYRRILEDFQMWKSRKDRKPLILRGARQVGKTWLMKEFGRLSYARTIYINFDNNPEMEALFAPDMRIERLIAGLEQYTGGGRIDPAETLLVFDEVQEVPRALTSLKYFNENAPQYDIICAGSLLGIALHPGTSFPVGKVEFMDVRPLSFREFLQAVGEERFIGPLEQGDFQSMTIFNQYYKDLLKTYYFVGGMPEALCSWTENRDLQKVREIQRRILDAYEQDFSKHAPSAWVPRIRMLWNSIPTQLSRENKKFMYGIVKKGARAAEYETALLWLSDCGLVHQVHRLSAPRLPLKAYEDPNAFKLFTLDVGILSCMADLAPGVLLDTPAQDNRIFREWKGALTEQYVLQELKTQKGLSVHYWSNDRGMAEVDFVVGNGSCAVPLEVKAELNLQAKSLKSYMEKFSPALALRASMSPYRSREALTDLPLYAVGIVKNLL